MIYLIKNGDTCKIGFSNNPTKRLRQLQTANPNILELVKTIEGGKGEEQALHHIFKHLKLKGEWFEFTSEIMDYFDGDPVTSLLTVKKRNNVVMSYEHTLNVNHTALSFLSSILSPQELGRIMCLTTYIEPRTNILMNSGQPHTDKTLSESIGYTVNKYRDFMNKMYKTSIVHKLNGKERTVFILNPHLARVSKTVKKELLPLFENISTNKGQEIVRRALTNYNRK